jgi:hypothetical protein
MQWFLELMEELGIECRVGHPAKIRKAETRKQKHDRRDARLLLTLLAENKSKAGRYFCRIHSVWSRCVPRLFELLDKALTSN